MGIYAHLIAGFTFALLWVTFGNGIGRRLAAKDSTLKLSGTVLVTIVLMIVSDSSRARDSRVCDVQRLR